MLETKASDVKHPHTDAPPPSVHPVATRMVNETHADARPFVAALRSSIHEASFNLQEKGTLPRFLLYEARKSSTPLAGAGQQGEPVGDRKPAAKPGAGGSKQHGDGRTASPLDTGGGTRADGQRPLTGRDQGRGGKRTDSTPAPSAQTGGDKRTSTKPDVPTLQYETAKGTDRTPERDGSWKTEFAPGQLVPDIARLTGQNGPVPDIAQIIALDNRGIGGTVDKDAITGALKEYQRQVQMAQHGGSQPQSLRDILVDQAGKSAETHFPGDNQAILDAKSNVRDQYDKALVRQQNMQYDYASTVLASEAGSGAQNGADPLAALAKTNPKLAAEIDKVAQRFSTMTPTQMAGEMKKIGDWVAANNPDATPHSPADILRSPEASQAQKFDAIRALVASGVNQIQIGGQNFRLEVEAVGRRGDAYVHMFKQNDDGSKEIPVLRTVYRVRDGGDALTRSAAGGFYENEQSRSGQVGFAGDRFSADSANGANGAISSILRFGQGSAGGPEGAPSPPPTQYSGGPERAPSPGDGETYQAPPTTYRRPGYSQADSSFTGDRGNTAGIDPASPADVPSTSAPGISQKPVNAAYLQGPPAPFPPPSRRSDAGVEPTSETAPPSALPEQTQAQSAPFRTQSDRARFYTRQKDKWSCGDHALAMAIGDKKLGRPMSDREVSQLEQEAHHHGGDWQGGVGHMATLAKQYGLNAEYKFGHVSMDEVDKQLVQGRGVVVDVRNPATGGGHYVYIAGKTRDGKYIVGDPNRKGNPITHLDQATTRQYIQKMMDRAPVPGYVAIWAPGTGQQGQEQLPPPDGQSAAHGQVPQSEPIPTAPGRIAPPPPDVVQGSGQQPSDTPPPPQPSTACGAASANQGLSQFQSRLEQFLATQCLGESATTAQNEFPLPAEHPESTGSAGDAPPPAQVQKPAPAPPPAQVPAPPAVPAPAPPPATGAAQPQPSAAPELTFDGNMLHLTLA